MNTSLGQVLNSLPTKPFAPTRAQSGPEHVLTASPWSAYNATQSPSKTMHNASSRPSYWQQNLKILAVLLTVWFIVSYGLGILFVEPLNAYSLWGFPLGFWFSQQGSIYVFFVLVLIYAIALDRLDRRYRATRSADEEGEE